MIHRYQIRIRFGRSMRGSWYAPDRRNVSMSCGGSTADITSSHGFKFHVCCNPLMCDICSRSDIGSLEQSGHWLTTIAPQGTISREHVNVQPVVVGRSSEVDGTAGRCFVPCTSYLADPLLPPSPHSKLPNLLMASDVSGSGSNRPRRPVE